MKLEFIFLSVCFFAFVFSSQAQEFNATVSVNSSKIQGTNRQVFTSMEEALRTFINDRKWTNANFNTQERIDCSFTIIINEMPSNNSFKSELLVQARRPVFNSTYTTTLLNFRDTQFDFDYMEYQPLEFEPNRIAGNLVATIAFYVNLILGLDFDSMSPMGGTPYFQQMQEIVSNVQSNGWSGWESSFGAQRNRYAISAAFNDASQEFYRKMWYKYHREGLDKMAENAASGREAIVQSIPVIGQLYSAKPTSVLVTLFGDAKLDEIANVFTQAAAQQKQEAYNMLRAIYPTRTTELDKIQKSNK